MRGDDHLIGALLPLQPVAQHAQPRRVQVQLGLVEAQHAVLARAGEQRGEDEGVDRAVGQLDEIENLAPLLGADAAEGATVGVVGHPQALEVGDELLHAGDDGLEAVGFVVSIRKDVGQLARLCIEADIPLTADGLRNLVRVKSRALKAPDGSVETCKPVGRAR